MKAGTQINWLVFLLVQVLCVGCILVGSDVDEKADGGLLFGGKRKLLWPAKGVISSGFGHKRGARRHKGIDIAAPRGTDIRAAASGRVTYAGWKDGYGLTIIVRHRQGSTLYAHCARLRVTDGDWVDKGDLIAYMGSSGDSSGSHLHFEYRDRRWRAMNPMKYLVR